LPMDNQSASRVRCDNFQNLDVFSASRRGFKMLPMAEQPLFPKTIFSRAKPTGPLIAAELHCYLRHSRISLSYSAPATAVDLAKLAAGVKIGQNFGGRNIADL